MTLVWKSGYSFDSDASTYIDAVETADGQALETGVRVAINDFVLGCKQDGIWNAIKASCILAGARTLDGALVPLVGAAPTKNGTEGGWNYNRETGLEGNGTDNYLDSNRAANADPQNDMHLAVNLASIGSGLGRYIGAYSGPGTADDFLDVTGNIRNRSIDTPANVTVAVGLYGTSRTASTAFTVRSNATTVTGLTFASTAPGTQNHFIFSQNDNGLLYGASNARLSFYSIGESLDLAALDTRVSNLMTAIGAAIP